VPGRSADVLILIVGADSAPITSRSAAQFAPEFDPQRDDGVGGVDRMNGRTTDVDGVKVAAWPVDFKHGCDT